jgi:MYXO-CTERM domain-containing protein
MIYNSIELVTLQKDETYYILADNWQEDAYLFGDSAVNYSNDVEWIAHSWTTGNSIFDTATHQGSDDGGVLGNFGPGFMYRAVPSPGALALLGLAGIASRRRRTA